MKKPFFLLLFLNILHAFSYAQGEKGLIDSTLYPTLKMHYLPEYTFDLPVDVNRWKNEKPGLQVAFGSTDKTYFRTEVPDLPAKPTTWEATGWKGERLNTLIVTWSPDTISQVRFVLNDLKNNKGNTISKKNLQLHMVRYVVSNYPYDARDVTCGVGPVDKAYLMPDRFDPIAIGSTERFDLPGRSVRSVWLSADIPSGTVPGIYNGTVEVKSDNGSSTLQLKIIVQNQVLPKPHDWSFRLDLWQNPWVIAEYYQIEPWSKDHETLLKKHLKLYADAGGKFITTYAVHSPWADNSYMVEGGMIEWIKRKNGSWRFDYSIFDQYVQLAMETGIDDAITIYTPIPWGERFRYLDETTGGYVHERWLPTSDTFKTNWNIFLTDLKTHLLQKGWLNKTYLGINENAMEQTLSAIKVIRDHSKDWKITYAGDWHSRLDNLLDDYSCVYGKEPKQEDVKKRSSKKQTSTYYICCTPPKPNTFVFSPPIEGRWLGWYAMAYGYDGLLRWAYDAWPADPVRDSRHVLWPAGDCFMIYPGGGSSVRFEKMREGIVDFEKIRIIRNKAAKSTDPKIKDLLQQLNQQLQKFTVEKEFKEENLRADVRKGMQLVEQLSEKIK